MTGAYKLETGEYYQPGRGIVRMADEQPEPASCYSCCAELSAANSGHSFEGFPACQACHEAEQAELVAERAVEERRMDEFKADLAASQSLEMSQLLLMSFFVEKGFDAMRKKVA